MLAVPSHSVLSSMIYRSFILYHLIFSPFSPQHLFSSSTRAQIIRSHYLHVIFRTSPAHLVSRLSINPYVRIIYHRALLRSQYCQLCNDHAVRRLRNYDHSSCSPHSYIYCHCTRFRHLVSKYSHCYIFQIHKRLLTKENGKIC